MLLQARCRLKLVNRFAIIIKMIKPKPTMLIMTGIIDNASPGCGNYHETAYYAAGNNAGSGDAVNTPSAV